MSNPFKDAARDWVEVTESRLECEKCGKIVTEGKYMTKLKVLSWKCPDCEHISKIEMSLDV